MKKKRKISPIIFGVVTLCVGIYFVYYTANSVVENGIAHFFSGNGNGDWKSALVACMCIFGGISFIRTEKNEKRQEEAEKSILSDYNVKRRQQITELKMLRLSEQRKYDSMAKELYVYFLKGGAAATIAVFLLCGGILLFFRLADIGSYGEIGDLYKDNELLILMCCFMLVVCFGGSALGIPLQRLKKQIKNAGENYKDVNHDYMQGKNIYAYMGIINISQRYFIDVNLGKGHFLKLEDIAWVARCSQTTEERSYGIYTGKEKKYGVYIQRKNNEGIVVECFDVQVDVILEEFARRGVTVC